MLNVSRYDTVTPTLVPLLILTSRAPRHKPECLKFLVDTIARLGETYQAALDTITTRQVQIDLAAMRLLTRNIPGFDGCIQVWDNLFRLRIQQDAEGSRTQEGHAPGEEKSPVDVPAIAAQVLRDMQQADLTCQTLVAEATEPRPSPSGFTSLWA